MPLYPMRAFVGSPSSLRLRNVPKRIGDWCIRSVDFTAVYPDGTVKSAPCVLTGGVWVGTIEGTSTSGTSKNGYTIFASGTDENGNPITGYVLGKGDIEILNADGTLNPDAPSFYVHYFETMPEQPHAGDSTFLGSTYYIYDGTQWKPCVVASTPSFIQDANHNKIEADGDYVKTIPMRETTWHFSARVTSPIYSHTSGDATYDSELQYWRYTDSYGTPLDIYAVAVEGVIEGWRVVGTLGFFEPEGGRIVERVDFELAGDKYTESLHYDNYGFTIDLTRDAIATGKLVTDIDLSAALELKQDKLSEDQNYVIDSEVDDLYTHIQTVGGAGNYTFKSPDTFDKSLLIEQGILSSDGTTWIYPPVTVIMGTNVLTINNGAFLNATNLLTFRGENVRILQTNVFSGCSALQTVDIPNAVSIGTYAFRYCAALKTLTLPKSVTAVSRNAFVDTSFDQVFFEGKTLAQVKAMTNFSRWGLAEDKIFTDAYENQLPTKTS